MIDQILHKFYAASISIDPDGSLLVESTGDRVKAWAALFCLAAAACLAAWLAWRGRRGGRAALGLLLATLAIPVQILPSVRQESIQASRAAIVIESGAWYWPTRTELAMTGVRHIREVDSGDLLPGNLIGDPPVDWHITWNDGRREVLELNEFFNAHRMVVAYYYKDRGYWLERMEEQE